VRCGADGRAYVIHLADIYGQNMDKPIVFLTQGEREAWDLYVSGQLGLYQTVESIVARADSFILERRKRYSDNSTALPKTAR
jgi:hypothetical protein